MRTLQGNLCLGKDKRVMFYDSSAPTKDMSLYELRPEDEIVVSDDGGREVYRGKVGEKASPLGVCPIDWLMWGYRGMPAAMRTEHKSMIEGG